MFKRLLRLAGAAAALGLGALLAGCPGAAPPAGGSGGPASGSAMDLEFWHTRRGEMEQVLKAICDEYNRANPQVRIVPAYQGRYDDLNKKVRSVIQAKALPALSVAYESHVSEYMANGVIRPLDDLVKDPEIGFKPEELADIPEQYLKSNRFPQHGDQLLSFPFTKSNLVLYYNQSLLEKAGFQGPAPTWDEFETQAAALTKQIGAPAYAFTPDPSTLDGLIYSYGGEVLAEDGARTLFDLTPTIRAFEMLQRMRKAGTLVYVERPDDITGLFVGQRCALVIDSSSGRANLESQVGDQFRWDIAMVPHASGTQPVTVMYGPNVCLFKSTPEKEREAWKFVRHFTSPEVTARWARETGYLPVRRSAAELPEMKAFYEQNPRARHVYETLPFARGEPNVLGWQEVRTELATAAKRVATGETPPADAAVNLKKKADAILAQSK